MLLRHLITLLLLGLLSGCQSLQFYHQAVMGQARLLLARESSDTILRSSPDPALRDRIMLANEILAFAEANDLPSNSTYSSYVETGQPFIVWNVFAARPFELQLKQHCFPIAGCVSYRGYFSKSDAEAYASRLQAEGYEIYVAGAAAYSTLGWLNDPLLDTFLFRREDQLAALLFHELAHQMLYVPGDTRFNESMATTVEQHLLKQWLQARGQAFVFDSVLASRDRRSEVIGLIQQARMALRDIYESSLSRNDIAVRKQEIFEGLRDDYRALRETWHEGSEYSGWIAGELNNAKLETVADYNEWVPVLSELLQSLGLPAFRERMLELASMTADQRRVVLEQLRSEGSKGH